MNLRAHSVALVLALTSTGYLLAQNAPPASVPPGPPAPGQGRVGAPAPTPVPDTPPDPVVRPPNGAALFTDDFEAGQLDAKKWTSHVSGDQTI
ncbi:MAG: hypothetical protein ABIW19_08435, partial [Vicinamibacterales bacterium]